MNARRSPLRALLTRVAVGASVVAFDFSTNNFATGQEHTFRFQPSVSTLAGAVLTGALVGFLGGLVPAVSAARTNPIRAMRV